MSTMAQIGIGISKAHINTMTILFELAICLGVVSGFFFFEACLKIGTLVRRINPDYLLVIM